MDKNSGDWRLLDEAWTFLALADEAQRMGDRRSAERLIDLAMQAFDAAEELDQPIRLERPFMM